MYFPFFLVAFVLNVCTNKENNNNYICRPDKEKNGMPILSKCFFPWYKREPYVSNSPGTKLSTMTMMQTFRRPFLWTHTTDAQSQTRVHLQRGLNENGATSRVKYIAPFQFYFFLLGVYFRDALDFKEIRNDIIPPEIPLWIVDSWYFAFRYFIFNATPSKFWLYSFAWNLKFK